MSSSAPLMVPRSVCSRKKLGGVVLHSSNSEQKYEKNKVSLVTESLLEVSTDTKLKPQSSESEIIVDSCSTPANDCTSSQTQGEVSDENFNKDSKSNCDITVNKGSYPEDIETDKIEANTSVFGSYQKTCSVSSAIHQQTSVTFVDTGPISYSKRVPVYWRRRRPATALNKCDMNSYTGLTWRPPSSKSTRSYNPHSKSAQENEYYPRHWEYTPAGRYYMRQPELHRGFEFTVMSYNVLAQNLLEDNYNLYMDIQPEVLEWKYRRKLLLKELKYHAPDVICLQEVNSSHYDDFFLPELRQRGYEGVYMKRTGDKLDGCATFYKKRKFVCEEVISVPFYNAQGGPLLDRDNVALIVKLKARTKTVPAHKSLVIANTHLLFNPRRGDIKLAQVMILLAEIDKCSHLDMYPDKYHPVIICGDFNSEPHSELYKLMVMGYLEYEGLLNRIISGQEDGMYGKSGAILKKDFFPSKLGISDSCQYCRVVRDRTRSKYWNQGLQFDDDVIMLDYCGNEIVPGGGTKGDVEETCTQGSGCLKHQLRLVSVYEHWLSRLNYQCKEVTTHHGQTSCTVDYIFYGVGSGLVRFHQGEVQTKDIKEGHLNLLARYELLSCQELQRMGGLPNEAYGSDHLSIMARFLLT